MSNIKDGGPAFPVDPTKTMHLTNPTHFQGMSLRDWFAGQALASLAIRVQQDDLFTEEDAIDTAFRLADMALSARKTGGSE